MRDNTRDKTLQRNYLSKWRFLIQEYEQVKAGRHPKLRFVSDFYRFHHTNRQTFLKYYHRASQSGDISAVLPQKRGPRWRARRPDLEQAILAHRQNGVNRYEIYTLLLPEFKELTPSPSTIYRILKRYGVNRMSVPMKQNKRRIIKHKAGELGHIDCHCLSRDLIVSDPRRRYLVCVLDDCTRVAWAEVVEDVKSLTVMFSTLKILNLLNLKYRIQFAEMLSDNGSEFASRRVPERHPFERMLQELGIRHRYTRPYRPQTNGKVERFWRTLNEDLIEGTTFETEAEFRDELEQYLLYYNEYRPHQGINAKTPKQMNDSCQRISEPIQFPQSTNLPRCHPREKTNHPRCHSRTIEK